MVGMNCPMLLRPAHLLLSQFAHLWAITLERRFLRHSSHHQVRFRKESPAFASGVHPATLLSLFFQFLKIHMKHQRFHHCSVINAALGAPVWEFEVHQIIRYGVTVRLARTIAASKPIFRADALDLHSRTPDAPSTQFVTNQPIFELRVIRMNQTNRGKQLFPLTTPCRYRVGAPRGMPLFREVLYPPPTSPVYEECHSPGFSGRLLPSR